MVVGWCRVPVVGGGVVWGPSSGSGGGGVLVVGVVVGGVPVMGVGSSMTTTMTIRT